MTGQRPEPAVPEPKRPYHLGVAIGVTTGAYALSLMAASTLQIQQDRALIADREPMQAAITVLGSHHDAMEPRLEEARARYSDGADGYGSLTARLDTLRQRLAAMDKTVAGIERDGGTLAARVPAIPGVASRPAQGASGRSSGGASTGGGSTGAVTTAPRAVPPAPKPVAKPPVSGSTGASGAP